MSKFRDNFITNSSSSSYIVVYEIKDCPELQEYMKEEHGKQGINKYHEYLNKGIDLLNKLNDTENYIREDFSLYEDDDLIPFKINNDNFYIYGSRVSYTNEGNTDSDSMKIVDMIPKEYKTNIYKGESN